MDPQIPVFSLSKSLTVAGDHTQPILFSDYLQNSLITEKRILEALSGAVNVPAVTWVGQQSGTRTQITFFFVPTSQSNTAAATMPRQYPDRMYVAVPTVAIFASSVVIVLCAMSLALGFTSRFNLIHPIFAAVFLFWAASFLVLARMLQRAGRRNANSHRA
jgi:hypothetical protein